MPFPPLVSWLFFQHIIKLTSVEVFFGEEMTSVLSLRGDGSISKCLVKSTRDGRNAVHREFALISSGVLETHMVQFVALLKISGVQVGPPLNENFLKVQVLTNAPTWALPWMCD